ncbi:MAG: hypothetical protein ABIA75_02510 [Candidatus Neomarinimicrobiota bacterium]
MSSILFGIAILSVIWGILSAMVMMAYLNRRGHKVSFLLVRLLIFKYINQYRDLTEKDTGKPGIWFYSYIAAMNLALLCAIIGAILK